MSRAKDRPVTRTIVVPAFRGVDGIGQAVRTLFPKMLEHTY